MPSTYAHHIFGAACIETMPDKLKTICNRYRELFDFGVHGPDLLFYYKPLKSNEVTRHGQELHHWSGAQLFEIFKYVYQGKQETVTVAEKNAMLAYLLGFLAHFTLDSSCHAYINTMTEESEYSHNMIESQYEAYLMGLTGDDPLKVDRSKAFKATRENAAIIGKFFPFDEKCILQTMKGQKQTLHLFYSPYEIKKKTIRELVSLLKIKGDFGDLFLDRETIPFCEATNKAIYERQMGALEHFPEILLNFLRFLYDKEPLSDFFKSNFEGEIDGVRPACAVAVTEICGDAGLE